MILERFFPDLYIQSIYDLPLAELKEMGIRGLVFDIDNTVAPFDVADPDDSEDDAGNKHVCPHHHEKSDPHHQRHRDDDAELGLHRHAFFLHKAFQVLFVELCAHKPVVELLGGVCKEKRYSD